jgi:hypothetical protein
MRSPLRRVGSALLGLWLTFVVAEPMPMHACAMHDGVGAAAHSAAAHETAGPAAPASAHTAHHGAQHAADGATPTPEAASGVAHDAPTDAPSAPSHGACLCLGDCCAAGAPIAPSAPIVALAAADERGAESWSAGAAVATTPDSQRRLPWANGPPAIG